MRRSLAAVAALCSLLTFAGARADVPSSPVAQQNRSTEPVVLTGSQFPAWSAGPELDAHEPQSTTNSSTVNQWGMTDGTPLESACYRKPNTADSNPADHPNPWNYNDNGDHSCYQPNRVPYNPNVGADVHRIVGYKWDGSRFVQIPFQVDELFTRYITNNNSDFAFYSGVDQETTYAWDREGFRFTWDDYLYKKILDGRDDGNPCIPMPAPGPDGKPGPATTPDPVKGLDDNDELAFMASDASAAAPIGAPRPAGLNSLFDVRVVDPTDPAADRHVYVGLADAGGPSPSDVTPYVTYQRDPGAGSPGAYTTTPSDLFIYSQSSYGGYGAAPAGAYCNRDGSIATQAGFSAPPGIAHPADWKIQQRRPVDSAWVRTPRYEFRYDGRWLMTELHVANNDDGIYGPDIIDQWKARAFQQRPGGKTPCCGYEEEVNNWGGSSILFGERSGPVRAIRAAWGADSSTNNIKTEIFYRDEIRFRDNLRVHVIPPLDGIYVQWDYNGGAMLGPDGHASVGKYYNPWVPNGVAIDGHNDEVFGNTYIQASQGGAEFRDGDPMPVVGPQDQKVGNGGDCSNLCNDIDLADPFFSGPVGTLNWEEIASPHGSLVTRWTVRQHTGGDAYSVIAQPYYRDESCFDDGTGTDPGPHLHGRGVDNGAESTYVDPSDGNKVKPRVCWTPADGDPNDTSVGDGRPRKFWQGDIATHGLHLQIIAESDNAQVAEPIDEIDSEQRMAVLPGLQGNVGDEYGRNADYPLGAVITLYPF